MKCYKKHAITTRDGVFVNPLIGKKKSGDFKDEVIVKAYETMIEKYYPENRCQLATLHTEMKYAGPKEAIHHAIMRQKLWMYSYHYRTRSCWSWKNSMIHFAAHKIFDDYPELEIEPIFFPSILLL